MTQLNRSTNYSHLLNSPQLAKVCGTTERIEVMQRVLSKLFCPGKVPAFSSEYNGSHYDGKRPRKEEPLEEKRKTRKELLKEKYKKTIEEIRRRIIIKRNIRPNHEHFKRICEELSMALLRILLQFGEKYGPSCDIMRKYETSFSEGDENRMFEDILAKVQGERKIHADLPEMASKSARPSVSDVKITDLQEKGHNVATTSRWDIPHLSASNLQLPVAPIAMVPNPFQIQDPVKPEGYMQQFKQNFVQSMPKFSDQTTPSFQPPQNIVQPPKSPDVNLAMFEESGYNLYLCKEDFEPITREEAKHLRLFLVQQIFEATASEEHAPNFTLKGLQSLHRYEVTTEDPASKDWLLRLDFSRFFLFNVLVYTKEELWYERAAIWLPGHSKSKNIEPLVKLLLQNKKIDGLNIGKWKLVKKIVNTKGTRIYVDMPPSSARALEKQKMLLSYELQKVSVFLKAVAVDKEAFDAGLKENTITDAATLKTAADNTAMPVVPHDPKMIKICFKGNKPISVEQSRRVKDMIIYQIFKYHQEPTSQSRTDFLKYGFMQPGYFGVLPENGSSGRWLKRLDIGKLNRHEIVILGDDASNTKYFRMYVDVNQETGINAAMIFQRLKQCNRGDKGLHFVKWKAAKIIRRNPKSVRLYLEVDLESVERLIELHFRLDYQKRDVHVSHHDYGKLVKMIKKYKAETTDKYDVANMELDSGDDEHVVMLD